jgi:hypothetical protein
MSIYTFAVEVIEGNNIQLLEQDDSNRISICKLYAEEFSYTEKSNYCAANNNSSLVVHRVKQYSLSNNHNQQI